jgi:hypothetical protein
LSQQKAAAYNIITLYVSLHQAIVVNTALNRLCIIIDS